MSDLKNKIKIGSFWVIFFFGASQLLRLAGNLIVTRLLVPEMFGVMSVIIVLIQGLAMFSDVGLWAFIIKSKKGLDEQYLNTAWTIQVIRGWIIFALLLFIAFVLWYLANIMNVNIGGVYGHPVVPSMIAVVGIAAIFHAHKSMAPAIVSREILRGKLEAIELFSQFLGAIVMITWAWTYPSIWALASATLVSSLTSTILTNVIFHYRHSFEINREAFRDIMRFGKWIVLSSVFTFISAQGDKLFFGHSISAAELGIYSIAFLLATSLAKLIQSLSSKIWFPLFSDVAKKDRSSLRGVYYNSRLKLDMVVGLVSGFLMATGTVWIQWLYDSRYQDAGWMLEVLSISLMGTAISSFGLNCLTAIGVSKVWANFNFIRTIGILVGLPVMFNFYGMHGAVYMVAANVFIALPVMYLEMNKHKLLLFKNEFYIYVFGLFGYLLGLAFKTAI